MRWKVCVVTYSDLLFLFGQAQTACADVWPADFAGWPAIVLADYLRGIIELPYLMDMYGLMAPEYQDLSICIMELAQ